MIPKNETCEWFRAQTYRGDYRWYAGCQAEKGVSSTYTTLSPVCSWCGCKVRPQPQQETNPPCEPGG
jgi:hypothetical protein